MSAGGLSGGGSERGSGAASRVDKEQALLVHCIPDSYTQKDIFNLISIQTNIIPLQVTPIIRPTPTPNTGKAYLQFSTGRYMCIYKPYLYV